MIETGSKNASVDTLWRITGALDMRLSELIRLVETGMTVPCWSALRRNFFPGHRRMWPF